LATQIQIKRGSTTPAGLTVGESAMNTSTNQIYLGGTGGTVLVGGEVTGGVDMGAGSAVSANRIPTQSGVYNYVRNSTVTSFNGLTGAVGGVCAAQANTFTALQTFTAGISAAGGTFSALTQFTAGLSGHINISETNASGNMYLLMARGTGVTAVFADTTTTPLVYQASAGNLGMKGITLANGNDRLYITPTQITATNTVTPSSAYFYFIAAGGNYLQSPILSQMGDISAENNALCLSVDPATRIMTWGDGVLYTGVTSGFFGVNRSPAGMCADYAVEINSPTGKGLQLIYNDYTGAASNWVNMDVSSGGNYTVRPSGGLATVTGTLNVSAGVCAAGATLSGLLTTSAGISAAGGVTLAGNFSGATGSFSRLLTASAGISASALTVSGGATFSGNVYLGDAATGVTADSNDFVRILAGTNSYGLWNGVAGIYQSRKNLSASTSGVICATPEIYAANYTTVELMVEYAENLAFYGGAAWASHKFVINVSSDEEYGGILTLSYTESIIKTGSIATVPFIVDASDLGNRIEVTATVPANSSKSYSGWRFKTTMRVY
jgi:hypothetical protein